MSSHAKVDIGGEILKLRLNWGAMKSLSEKYDRPFQEVLELLNTGKAFEVIQDMIFFGLEQAKNPKAMEWLDENMDLAGVEGYMSAITSQSPGAAKKKAKKGPLGK